MKVVGISDIHGQLFSKKNIPECDIVCICGDIMPLEIDRNIIASTAWFVGEFIPWCEKLPCKYVLFTPGNHDFLFDELSSKIYICEVNAIPGSLAYYFFKKNKILTNDLLEKLIGVAERNYKKTRIKEEFIVDLLSKN